MLPLCGEEGQRETETNQQEWITGHLFQPSPCSTEGGVMMEIFSQVYIHINVLLDHGKGWTASIGLEDYRLVASGNCFSFKKHTLIMEMHTMRDVQEIQH